MKANTREAGADVQQSGLFRCRPSGRWGTFPSPGENGVSCLKDHLPISVEAEVFIRWGGEQNKELKRGACMQSSLCADEARDGLVCLVLL